jgi:hypothetical protein
MPLPEPPADAINKTCLFLMAPGWLNSHLRNLSIKHFKASEVSPQYTGVASTTASAALIRSVTESKPSEPNSHLCSELHFPQPLPQTLQLPISSSQSLTSSATAPLSQTPCLTASITEWHNPSSFGLPDKIHIFIKLSSHRFYYLKLLFTIQNIFYIP